MESHKYISTVQYDCIHTRLTSHLQVKGLYTFKLVGSNENLLVTLTSFSSGALCLLSIIVIILDPGAGLEPTSLRHLGSRSNQLSYLGYLVLESLSQYCLSKLQAILQLYYIVVGCQLLVYIVGNGCLSCLQCPVCIS